MGCCGGFDPGVSRRADAGRPSSPRQRLWRSHRGERAELPGLPAASGALIHAVLEIAGGMHALCTAPLPPTLRAVIMAAASGFSGLSILMQNRLFLRPLGVSLRHLIGFGLVRAAGAGAAMWAMLAIFP